MPNHVTNVITINGVPDKRVDEILTAIKADDAERNSIDFNKIIPMPPELNVESGSRSDMALKLYKEFLVESAILSKAQLITPIPESVYAEQTASLIKKYEKLTNNDPSLLSFGRQLLSNIQQYGHADWYSWSNHNWGTKWNSYGYDCPAGHDAGNQIEFMTAWSGVKPIMDRLSQMFPDAEFHYQWADEDIGVNVGEQIWQNGEAIFEGIPETQSAEAYEMAAEICSLDLKTWGYVYSDKDNTYHYEEQDSEEYCLDEELSGNKSGMGMEMK